MWRKQSENSKNRQGMHNKLENGAHNEPKGAKGRQKWAEARQKVKREPKGSKRKPKGAKREPKGSQREPKGAKGSQSGAKKTPKVSQRATKMHQKIDVRKRLRKEWILGGPGYYRILHFGSHFHQNSMKKSMRKSMPKKLWKLKKIDAKTVQKLIGNSDDFRKVASRKNAFSEKGVNTQTIIFMQ